MKILKGILLSILGTVVLALIAAWFLKNEYKSESTIVINKPVSEVYDYVKFLKNQDNYSKWATLDPNLKKTFRGTDANPGFVSAWDSAIKDVGAGEQEILRLEPNKRIDFELRFFKPFVSTEKAYITTTPINENQTEVKWGFNGRMDYPMNLMMPIMGIEKMISNDLKFGLEKLKTIIEK